jgi:hypothetical protein
VDNMNLRIAINKIIRILPNEDQPKDDEAK